MMTAIGSALRDHFRTRDHVRSAYLFGSHARGRAHRESDVDVAVLLDVVRFPTRERRSAAAERLNAEIIHTVGNNRVDVVVLNDVNPELGAAIVTDGVCVHCVDADADRAMRRRILLRHADLQPFLRRTRRLKLDAIAAAEAERP